MPTVRIQYFAVLREQRGQSEEVLSTTSTTAEALYEELRGRHGFSLPGNRIRVAIDGEFAPWNTPLREGAKLVFMPPVAGG